MNQIVSLNRSTSDESIDMLDNSSQGDFDDLGEEMDENLLEQHGCSLSEEQIKMAKQLVLEEHPLHNTPLMQVIPYVGTLKRCLTCFHCRKKYRDRRNTQTTNDSVNEPNK